MPAAFSSQAFAPNPTTSSATASMSSPASISRMLVWKTRNGRSHQRSATVVSPLFPLTPPPPLPPPPPARTAREGGGVGHSPQATRAGGGGGGGGGGVPRS